MKLLSSLCLLALILGALAPLHPTSPPSRQDDKYVIFTLDVCHAQGTMISGSSEMPSLSESPYTSAPPAMSGFHEGLHPTLAKFILAFRKERPPET